MKSKVSVLINSIRGRLMLMQQQRRSASVLKEIQKEIQKEAEKKRARRGWRDSKNV